MNENIMILNGKNIGISRIELDKSDLRIIDKYGTYCLQVCVYYNWKEINNIKIGKKENIEFNEYILHENNEAALILPSKVYVEKITNDYLCFYFNFENISKTITYMNERNNFDIVPNSLEVKVFIDNKDTINNSIIYEF